MGEFEPLEQEFDYVLSPEFGKVPDGLSGTLYRNGAGRWTSGGSPVGHLFDGDGMVSMFVFTPEGVRFRNRYVRTPHYIAGNGPDGPAGRGIGTMRGDGGIRANALRPSLTNLANTGVVMHAGRFLALFESGKPYLLDPDSLDTEGEYDFDGRLRGFGAFSAHPKIDIRSGELFNFGFTVLPRTGLNAYRVDKSGRLARLAQLPMYPPVLNHDFGLTERYLVFVVDPIVLSPLRLLPVVAGLRPMQNAIEYRAELGTEIILVPRDGGRCIRTHTDALLHFHIANCYDSRDETVVDLVRYTDDFDSMWSYFRADYKTLRFEPVFGGPLTRLRIGRDGRVIREELDERRIEFPQVDPRFAGRRNRFSYAMVIPRVRRLSEAGEALGQSVSAAGVAIRSGGIITYDHGRRASSMFSLTGYGSACEPTFVPRRPTAEEGDGWLVTIEYLREEHRSRLLILDAHAPDRGPCYVGALSHHLPVGLHGTFTSRVAAPAGRPGGGWRGSTSKRMEGPGRH